MSAVTSQRGRVLVGLLCVASACADPPPAVTAPEVAHLVTRAEATGYEETTRFADVIRFLESLEDIQDRASEPKRFHLTTFGETHEGRQLPLMVVGDVTDASPTAVRDAGRLTVWLQGTIHGGEVCGKEALLMLLRALAAGEHPGWTTDLVLLIAPVYNADGSEAIALDNRPLQHGPVGGMGERQNAQGLDLNRDHTKLESPEARALVSALNAYDPEVVIDLHTTNGTQHGYHLTYAPPLHPNTDPAIDAVLRDEWLPTVTQRVREKYGLEYHSYGNAFPADGPDRGWRTFDHRPRFNNNYAGLRNRFGILSEAYSYATFEDRVHATLRFVEEVLAFAVEHSARLQSAVEAADSTSVVGRRLSLRAEAARSDRPMPIRMGATVEERHPVTGLPMLRRTNVTTVEEMYEYGRFEGTLTDTVPAAYYVPGALRSVVEHLEIHGIRLETLDHDRGAMVEEFVITASTQSDRDFEGHRERTLNGEWRSTAEGLSAGTVVVPLEQPLGRLAFALLDPRSDDGIVNWNMVDEMLEGARVYPVRRAAVASGRGPQR